MAKRYYRWRVPFGYVVALVAVAFARPTGRSLLYGLALIVPGELLRIWAAGHVEKARKLATGGPYSHTQHPLYLGTCLITLGLATVSARPLVFVIAFAYLLAFFPQAVLEERRFLDKEFGDTYRHWAAEVPLFLPRVSPAGPRESHFAWQRVQANGEWAASFGRFAAVGLLFLAQRLPFLPL